MDILDVKSSRIEREIFVSQIYDYQQLESGTDGMIYSMNHLEEMSYK